MGLPTSFAININVANVLKFAFVLKVTATAISKTLANSLAIVVFDRTQARDKAVELLNVLERTLKSRSWGCAFGIQYRGRASSLRELGGCASLHVNNGCDIAHRLAHGGRKLPMLSEQISPNTSARSLQ